MTPPLAELAELAGTAVAVAAVLAALVYLGRAVRNAWRWFKVVLRTVRAIEDIVQRELEHNHGSSMKDDMHGIAVAVGTLQRTVDDHHGEFRHGLGVLNARIDHYHPPEPPEQDDPATDPEKGPQDA